MLYYIASGAPGFEGKLGANGFGEHSLGGYSLASGLVTEVAAIADRPFVAVGGIDHDNAPDVVGAGAPALAVVRAVYDAVDPAESARRLHELIVTRLAVTRR